MWITSCEIWLRCGSGLPMFGWDFGFISRFWDRYVLSQVECRLFFFYQTFLFLLLIADQTTHQEFTTISPNGSPSENPWLRPSANSLHARWPWEERYSSRFACSSTMQEWWKRREGHLRGEWMIWNSENLEKWLLSFLVFQVHYLTIV